MKILLAPGAVARLLNLSPSRVVQLDREGVLPASMRDSTSRRLYDPDAVDRFIRARDARNKASRSAPIGGAA